MSDDNIQMLDVKFKEPVDDDQMLRLIPESSGCLRHAYLIDPKSDKVSCANCTMTFNPMAVLVELSKQESRWNRTRKSYQEEMKVLNKRKRCTCRNCGQVTPII